LEPESLAAWARVVTGDSSAWVPGCIFETDTLDQNSNSSIPEQMTAQQRTDIQALTAEQRVERFLVIASPVAQQLAGYLAAAPLTLPVMRLVQQTMLPEARQVHLAEVFLGGLLKQVTPTDEHNPDLIQYDFVDDQVRECFLDRILLPDAIEILRRVSADIEKRMGYMLDFEALLKDPDGAGALALNAYTHPFANVAARVLRRLGGRYAHLGERLLQSQQQLQQELPAVGVLSDRQQPAPAIAVGSRHPLLPELIEIPAGPFLMGSSDADKQADSDEKPQHRLELPTYWIGKTPVTNAQFRPFVEGDGYSNRDYWTAAGWQWREQARIIRPRYWDDAKWNGDDYPVVGISWYEAVAYCRWLSAQTGHDIRLPTEAEWEKAARGPEGRIWPWGNTWEARRCNSKEAHIGKTTPVGRYPEGASPYGLLDMAGNVREWCATKWRKRYPYQVEDEWTDTYRAGDNARVRRGGAYYSEQKRVRCASRYYYYPHARYDNFGLRVARRSPQLRSDEW
jgi:formylglycine-generating enzyme required for sulfatase activity